MPSWRTGFSQKVLYPQTAELGSKYRIQPPAPGMPWEQPHKQAASVQGTKSERQPAEWSNTITQPVPNWKSSLQIIQQALNTLKRKGEFKELQKLMKFNLDFEKKGGKTLLKLLKIKDPRALNNELNKKGLGKKEAKALVSGILFKRKIKGKKIKK